MKLIYLEIEQESFGPMARKPLNICGGSKGLLMKNKSYEIGDLLYHPSKGTGSKYAIVMDVFSARHKPMHPCCGVPGFGVIWMDHPGDVYEFATDEWCETEKGFRLEAKGKRNV